jgi:hypothetical protein
MPSVTVGYYSGFERINLPRPRDLRKLLFVAPVHISKLAFCGDWVRRASRCVTSRGFGRFRGWNGYPFCVCALIVKNLKTKQLL